MNKFKFWVKRHSLKGHGIQRKQNCWYDIFLDLLYILLFPTKIRTSPSNFSSKLKIDCCCLWAPAKTWGWKKSKWCSPGSRWSNYKHCVLNLNLKFIPPDGYVFADALGESGGRFRSDKSLTAGPSPTHSAHAACAPHSNHIRRLLAHIEYVHMIMADLHDLGVTCYPHPSIVSLDQAIEPSYRSGSTPPLGHSGVHATDP